MEPPNIGHNLIASLIAKDADLNIFRSFSGLHVRNILYLQSELVELETKFITLDAESNDGSRGNDVWSLPRSWWHITRQNGEYMETVGKLREVSQQYCKSTKVTKHAGTHLEMIQTTLFRSKHGS